jgi:hypothetical protein
MSLRPRATACLTVVALLIAGCAGKSHPAAALPVADKGQQVCGAMIPLAVATTLAGTSRVQTSGSLAVGKDLTCGVYRGTGNRAQVLVVTLSSFLPDPANNAALAVGRALAPGAGYRLPPSEGYGLVTKGGLGTKGHDAVAITTSGDVEIQADVKLDAKGRDPVADARAVAVMLGPRLAPEWPKPPPGIDPAQPTSPPPTDK